MMESTDENPIILERIECNVCHQPDILQCLDLPNKTLVFRINIRDSLNSYYFCRQVGEWVLSNTLCRSPHRSQTNIVPLPGFAHETIRGVLTLVGVPTAVQEGIVEKVYCEVMRLLNDSGCKSNRILLDIERVYAERVALLEDEDEDDDEDEDEDEEYEVVVVYVPASSSSIRALERVRVEGKEVCTICLEEMGMETEAIRMPCQHVFHGGCIVEWLQKMHVCPLCRFKMPITTT